MHQFYIWKVKKKTILHERSDCCIRSNGLNANQQLLFNIDSMPERRGTDWLSVTREWETCQECVNRAKGSSRNRAEVMREVCSFGSVSVQVGHSLRCVCRPYPWCPVSRPWLHTQKGTNIISGYLIWLQWSFWLLIMMWAAFRKDLYREGERLCLIYAYLFWILFKMGFSWLTLWGTGYQAAIPVSVLAALFPCWWPGKAEDGPST